MTIEETDTDNVDLERRVEKLERENREMRQTLQKMLVNRRDVLKLGLGAAAGAVGLSVTGGSVTGRHDETGEICPDSGSVETTGRAVDTEPSDTDGTASNTLSAQSGSTEVLETTSISDSVADAVGQGNTNYYGLLQSYDFDVSETRKIYGIHSQLDASAKDTNDGDLTAIYCAARTSDQDVWALNPLVEITDDGDGYSGANSYAIEADVNTDVDGIGRGLLLSGVGRGEADVAVRVERMEGVWQSAIETKDVRNYHVKAMDADDNLVFGVQSSGNVDLSDGDIFNVNTLKGSVSEDLDINIGGQVRLTIQSDGGFGFFNDSGTKIADMDSSGNLTLAGGLTENSTH
ncbi:hypothetical protein [Haloarcula pellucida]|uniref:Uncharacterized protein n=1 Tax=Haloarcula pellucida TaxID=1427151 RepID=A0A830GKH6_9EURY|nr:hypothetical protein [Halomicroarcula pellucida]MBX0348731.1 hypothetical protein [Halomicroarcula pellucida]GGN92032.1 hypothetical protein GCM10009030_15790 [Halomicroarcula pellucida]